MKSAWSPAQYNRFKAERRQSFYDLLAMVQPVPGCRAIDLGCGTGELTRAVHDRLGCAATLGVDSSDTMLADSAPFTSEAVRFEQADIQTLSTPTPFDLVFSNAALHWIADHPALWTMLRGLVAPGGQLAVQIPANHTHASHTTAHEIASQEPFSSALGGWRLPCHVLAVEEYAALLDRLGFVEQKVVLRVYGHHLDTREQVAEWNRGALLTAYQKRLPDHLFEDFLARYRARLREVLADNQPFFYTYRRILMWARASG